MRVSKAVALTCIVMLALAGAASADYFLIVSEDTDAATALETSLTANSHTFNTVDFTAASALTPNDVMTNYNATLYVGLPSSGSEQDWCIALMDAGGNLMVADNDFAYFYCDGSNAMCTTYLESLYVSDAGSDGVLTGQDIMAGINPDISSDPYPDDFTISGTNGVVIFDAPSANAAGTAVERLDYRAIYLAWDYDSTSAAEIDAVTGVVATYLSEPVVPVELMSFSIE
ncbi:MAG: hypothetical protein V2I67_19540 [Thermoanaerobaculales bacterium]|nr:hypothetical protein [Thermoanaerobaculales bacterium]